MSIRVSFDRQDRRFHLGEVVSGTVELDPGSNATYTDIRVTYSWRTHGRGTPDHGREQSAELPAEHSPEPGSNVIRVPFRFLAPGGPVTYHGQYLNIDWYLTVRAQHSFWREAKQEEDFILQWGESNSARGLRESQIMPQVFLGWSRSGTDSGDIRHSGEPIPAPVPALHSRPSFATILGAIASVLVCGSLAVSNSAWLSEFLPGGTYAGWVIAALGLILLLVLLGLIFENAYKRKLQVRQLRVEPAMISLGGSVKCTLDFVARREVYLRLIRASISVRESATSQVGTGTETVTRVIHTEAHEKRYEQQLLEGQPILFACSLPVDASAPASFSAPNNKLEWSVQLDVELKGWLGLSKTFPIEVVAW